MPDDGNTNRDTTVADAIETSTVGAISGHRSRSRARDPAHARRWGGTTKREPSSRRGYRQTHAGGGLMLRLKSFHLKNFGAFKGEQELQSARR